MKGVGLMVYERGWIDNPWSMEVDVSKVHGAGWVHSLCNWMEYALKNEMGIHPLSWGHRL